MRKHFALSAVGAALSLTLVGAGVAFSDSGNEAPTPTREEALAALDHAQNDINSARAYILAQAPTPTTPPTTTTPPISTSPPPTSTSPSVPPTSPPPPVDPPAGSTSAATRFNWGAVAAGDEFNYAGRPVASKWGIYNGPGHAGNGKRVPTAFTVTDGILYVKGDARGNSGGMAYQGGTYRGKVEARMRVPKGDRNYHPVLLMWPDAEDWPVGGEIDYAEMTAASTKVDFFLHYGRSNSQTHAAKAIDITQWHNYGMAWDANCIKGFIDGEKFFEDCNTSHLPPRKMHMTIQLDAFNGTGPYIPSEMQVDWIRQYAP